MTELLGGGRLDHEALSSDPERLRRMKDSYKLEPDIVQDVDERYGPLDWRRPETHAIYWAHRGRQYASKDSAGLCREMIRRSLRALSRKPRGDPGPEDKEKP